MPTRRVRALDREVRHRLRGLQRRIGEDLTRIRTDAAATKARVAAAAGVDRSFLGRVEAGDGHASLETLVAVATALGADVSVRIYPGSGPKLADRHQSRMLEAVIRDLAPVWRPHLEVGVGRPSRGFIDAVFERADVPLLVASEVESALPRLEQQIRWSREKAASIGSSALVGDGPVPGVSRLLILRSTASTRAIANEFWATLQAAYPAPTAEAVASLRTGSSWPGDAIIWVRIDGGSVMVLDGPPRGVLVGRAATPSGARSRIRSRSGP